MSYKDIVNAKSPKEFINGFKKKQDGIPDAKNVAPQEEVTKEVNFTPTLPQVNVIPFSVFEKYQVKGIVRKFFFAGLAIVAVFALALTGGIVYKGVQQGKIDNLSAQQAEITAEVQSLQPYQVYKSAIESKRTTLTNTTATDINMGGLYSTINSSSDVNGVNINSLSVRQYAEGEQATDCINPDPFGDNSGIIGCIQITGGAIDKDSVNGFLAALESANDGSGSYKNPFISSFTSESGAAGGAASGPSSSFTATISFTTALYTNQYSNLALTLDELIATSSGQGTATNDEVATNETTESGN